MYTCQVDHWHNFSKNGLKPFVEIANLKFQGSFAKFGHVSSMCDHVLLSTTWHTSPSVLLFPTCHCSNCDMVWDQYIHFSCGIKGKWCKIFMGMFVQPICTFPSHILGNECNWHTLPCIICIQKFMHEFVYISSQFVESKFCHHACC